VDQERNSDGVETGPAAALTDRLREVPRPERSRILLSLLREQIASATGKPGPFPASAPFRQLGVYRDIATRLRELLAAATGVRIPATLLFDYPTCDAVVQFLMEALLGPDQAATPGRRSQGTKAGGFSGGTDADAGEPIAIVGMACRYAGGVATPEDLWRMVAEGRDGVSTFPTDRGWDLDGLYDPDPNKPGTCYTRHGAFLHDAALFDNDVFNISPREALGMDPQQRILLELAWEAMEYAGLDPKAMTGEPCGVYVGIPYSLYGPPLHKPADGMDGQLLTGHLPSVASGRISYTFGLQGPAVTVDTACSSSLVALHLAVQALRNGDCTMALTGGATVMSAPGVLMEFSRKRGLSVDGKCKAFSDDADGTGWGEGAGLILLERLSDAQANGHRVLAVVRGSAVNQDGASNGLTAPNGPSQQRVIRAALTDAGLTGADVDLVEAHGTGTALGDPIEAQALLATYGTERTAEQPLWLGSLKSNLGHTQAAAGVGGIIKVVEALRHEMMPKTLHVSAPSTHVDWSSGTVELLTEAREWAAGERVRRAGISAFGISGTNAHAIIEQAPEAVPVPADEIGDDADGIADVAVLDGLDIAEAVRQHSSTGNLPLPLVLSAVTPDALTAQAERLADYLAGHPDTPLADVAHTLATGRAALDRRAVVTAAGAPAAIADIRALASGELPATAVTGRARVASGGKVAFVFPGQGSQWAGMCVDLLDTRPVFAARIAECEKALTPYVDWSLTSVLRNDVDAPGLDRVDVVQPVLWAVMVALAALWQDAGVLPDTVIGHSQGEIAAACVAGLLSLDDAARVVALRSRAIGAIAGSGGMVSLALPRKEAEALIAQWGERISVAAVNGPAATVVAGDATALDELGELCRAEEIRARRIDVDYASHSAHVEALREQLAADLAPVTPQNPAIAFHSTVDSGLDTVAVGGGEYWYQNLRHTVAFQPAIAELAAAGHTAFIEISPHPVLTAGIQDTVDAGETDVVVTGTLRRDEDGPSRFTLNLGTAFAHGVIVDWSAVLGTARNTVELPTYAFQHRRFWLDSPLLDAAADVAGTAEPADSAFWDAVRGQDAAGLARMLAVDSEALAGLLPALQNWDAQRELRDLADAWRYTVRWRPVPVPGRPEPLTGTWLIAVPEGAGAEPLAEDVAAALASCGATVRTLTLDGAADRETVAELLRELARGTTGLAGVLSLLALDDRAHPDHPALPLGVSATLTLIQAAADAGIQAPLWCATRGAVAASASETVQNPAQAQVWGLGRVAALEHPKTWGGLIDLPHTPGGPHTDSFDPRVAQQLGAVLAGLDGEDQVALRASGVHGRRLVHASVGTTAPARRWRPAGTVLITGGTGAIGAHTARWLAANGAPKLILTSRRGLDAPGAQELLAELAELGTDAVIVRCDLADPDAVSALIRELEVTGQAVRSVFHTAGVADLAPLDDLGPAELAAVAAGKLAGALHLAAALDPTPLEAVVYFSSIAAIWGVADHGAYAAANAHLDALAQQQRAQGVPVHSIAWGPWAGGGMIADALEDTLNRRGVPLIAPEPSIRALQQVLDHDDNVLAVADVDWERFTDIFTQSRPSALIRDLPEVKQYLDGPATAPGAGEESGAAPEAAALVKRLSGLSEAQSAQVLLDLVRGQVARILGHASPAGVDADRAFKELGFDSISALELRNGLNTVTGLRIPVTAVFDHPTPLHLARYLRTRLLGAQPAELSAATTTTVSATADADTDPIVIVGMGCRYPGGVTSPDELWDLVAAEGEAISAFPTDRGWDLHGLFDPDPDHANTSYVRHGGFLHEAAEFDAGFFGISPREAVGTDPQQRLLLEVAWEALESARIDPRSLAGTSAGVFVGLADQAYGWRLGGAADAIDEGYLVTGAASSVASGRISYLLGLQGPAVTVDTACSSSLVALHMAVRALRAGDCTMALAGASMVMSTPSQFTAFSRQRGLAADGRCKAFSEAADGFGLAEGAALVVLERLSEARAHGHPVLAVVRGTALNQDGASNGLTAPSGPAQQQVIRAALADAGLTTADIDVVEAHGTGTALGDPIEAHALLATYGQDRDPGRPLWLGSVKSNIGHTQTASGLAGVIKMVQAMRHELLPKTLHVTEPSSHVDWAAGDVRLLTGARQWPAGAGTRRAGVSAFGISGTNAHVILEEAPVDQDAETGDAVPEPAGAGVLGAAAVPWVLSAVDASGLRAQAERLVSFLSTRADVDPAACGFSLTTTRSRFSHRAVAAGPDRDALLAGLRAIAAGAEAENVVTGRATASGGTVFVFPGQGSQWHGMGRELLDASPVFRDRIAECEAALAEFVDWSLSAVLRGEPSAPGLDRVDVVQPASWAVMVALAALWRSVGVRPDAVVGHSQGEIAAACVAGALSLPDAARVVALRSQALTRIAGRGGMASVALPPAEVRERLSGWEGRLSVAAVNSVGSAVVAGDVAALDDMQAGLEAEGIRVRRIEVDYASHSAHVEAVEAELASVLAEVRPSAAAVPMFSTLQGSWLTGTELDAGYWYRNLRNPVEFAGAVGRLADEGFGVFVECSAHPVLTTAVAQTCEDGGREVVVVGSLRRDEGGAERFLASVAQAFVQGVAVEWTAVHGSGHRSVDLPTYAFQRRRYWLEPDAARVRSHRDRDDRHDRRDRRDVSDSWRYRVAWQPVAEPDAPEPLTGTWLLAAPSGHEYDAVTTAVGAALRTRGASVLMVPVATGRSDRANRAAIAEQLRGHTALAGVVSLLALDEHPRPDRPEITAGFAATVALRQALDDGGERAPLWCVTAGAVAVDDDDLVGGPLQAQVWGLGIVAGLEDPAGWGGLVDLPQGPDGLDVVVTDRLCTVLAGLGGPAGAEDQIAIRDDGIHARRLVPAPAAASAPSRSWRPSGTVLVTGGTGALGAHTARWLAANGAPRLVLTSRRGLQAPGAPELLAELTAAGSETVIAPCDLADPDQVADLLAGVPQELPLTAVFHAAGVTGIERPLAELELDEVAGILAGKAVGARLLDELLGDTPLEAFVLYSSGAGVWGNAGQTAYAAGNAYLEALAWHRRSRGLAGTCVAWGAWDGGGMVDPAEAERLARNGVPLMPAGDAVRALQAVVDRDEASVLLARVDWPRFSELYSMARARPLISGLAEAAMAAAAAESDERRWGPGSGSEAADNVAAGAAGSAGAAGAAGTDSPDVDPGAVYRALSEDERRRALLQLVRDRAAGTLGLPDAETVRPAGAFRDLGFDSLTAVDLRNQLNARTGLRLPVAVVFDHPTPTALAAHLNELLEPATGTAITVPGPRSPLDALDHLELAAATDDEELRRAVVGRLRGLLRKWDAPVEEAAHDSGLVAVTDEEMFDLIDRELGIS
jgi:acyl transferase domain-containing protein/acyl carrier protein